MLGFFVGRIVVLYYRCVKMSERFDIHVQVRSSYKKPFGKQWLRLAQEYNVEGSQLVRRVFKDADDIVAYRKKKEATILEEENRLRREKLSLKTGR